MDGVVPFGGCLGPTVELLTRPDPFGIRSFALVHDKSKHCQPATALSMIESASTSILHTTSILHIETPTTY